MTTIDSNTLTGVTIDNQSVTEITADGKVVWRAGAVGSFENGAFRQRDANNRPIGWRYGDSTTGDSQVSKIVVRDYNDAVGGQACYSGYTANNRGSDPIWIEQDVDLTGADSIVYDIYGIANADRSSHRVYVDGTRIANNGTVSTGQARTGLTADVSGYDGVHTVRFSWVQIRDDNHGGSLKDNIRLVSN